MGNVLRKTCILDGILVYDSNVKLHATGFNCFDSIHSVNQPQVSFLNLSVGQQSFFSVGFGHC